MPRLRKRRRKRLQNQSREQSSREHQSAKPLSGLRLYRARISADRNKWQPPLSESTEKKKTPEPPLATFQRFVPPQWWTSTETFPEIPQREFGKRRSTPPVRGSLLPFAKYVFGSPGHSGPAILNEH